MASSQTPSLPTTSDSPEAERDFIDEIDGDAVWADDDDMDYEDTNESIDESLGESDLDEAAFYGR